MLVAGFVVGCFFALIIGFILGLELIFYYSTRR